MDDTSPVENGGEGSGEANGAETELARIKDEYRSRLVTAGLRTEAVRAGMIDLDGLKLLDTAAVELAPDDTIVGGRQIMQGLRKNKPWLFHAASSSSTSATPGSQPVRQKTAMEMTDEEYVAARSAITRR